MQRGAVEAVIGRGLQDGRPVSGNGQVGGLFHGVEGDPQAKAVGQGNFLFGCLAWVNFTAEMPRLEIFRHVFRHQMAPVAGRIDQDVVRGAGQRTVERGFEAGIAGLVFGEGQVVDEDNEKVGVLGEQLENIRQAGQPGFIDLYQPQTFRCIFGVEGLHQRGFSRATRAAEQYVVSGPAFHKLAGVGLDPLFLVVDIDQVFHCHPLRMTNGLEAARLCSPAHGMGFFPVDGIGSRTRIQTIEQAGDPGKKRRQVSHTGILNRAGGRLRAQFRSGIPH